MFIFRPNATNNEKFSIDRFEYLYVPLENVREGTESEKISQDVVIQVMDRDNSTWYVIISGGRAKCKFR